MTALKTQRQTAAIYPNLLYHDAAAAIAWLEQLGFECISDHRDDAGDVVHGELALDSAVVMLDAVCGGARSAGAEIAMETPDPLAQDIRVFFRADRLVAA